VIRLKDVIRTCQQQKVTAAEGDEMVDVGQIIECLRDLYEHLADERHAAGVNIPLR